MSKKKYADKESKKEKYKEGKKGTNNDKEESTRKWELKWELNKGDDILIAPQQPRPHATRTRGSR